MRPLDGSAERLINPGVPLPSFLFHGRRLLADHNAKEAEIMSAYQDYMELKNLFLGWIKTGVVISQEIKRLYWSELKRLERETRCHNADGTCCTKNCRKCDKQRDGTQLSLDQRTEIGDLPQGTFSVEMLFEEMELSEALYTALDRLSDREQLIVVLYSQGYTEREIAKAVNACQKSVNNWKRAAFAKLRASLKDFY